MSLFGDEDDSPKKAPTGTLFEESQVKPGGGLFGDDADPWIPTPKKRKLVSQLLDKSDIPDQYVDFFESHANGTTVAIKSLVEIMADASISKQAQDTIISILTSDDPDSNVIKRGAFYVGLVLVYLAQNNQDFSIDAVDDMKTKRLPIPKLSGKKKEQMTAQDVPVRVVSQSEPEYLAASPQQTTLDSYITTAPDSDSPLTSNNHSHHSQNVLSRKEALDTNPSGKDDVNDPWSPKGSQHTPSYIQPESRPARTSYVSNSNGNQSALGIDGVTVRALEGKEGIPLWKHINYEVKSAKRKSQVVRRYSDFAWLFDCLLKKYPFRQVPLLPPKKIAGMSFTGSVPPHTDYKVTGVHLHIGKTADMSFLEKRRRGLSRFVNALERHSTFRADQLVTTFLTVPTELSVWRKQASITVAEEFEDRYLPAELEGNLPPGIDEWMSRTQLALRNAIESFTQLTTLQERIIKRQEVNCIDHLRFGASITSFCERESGHLDILGQENGPGIMRGLQSIAKQYNSVQQSMAIESRAWEDNFLEDLKRYRGVLASMNELFIRHARYSGDDIPNLEKRIANAQTKLANLDAKPETKELDKDKLKSSIASDEQSIVKFKNRRVFIKECVWHELQYFEAQQIHISKFANDMAVSRLDFSKKYVEIASTLVGDVEGMP